MFKSGVQLVGLVMVGAGVGVELALRADPGFWWVTIGSVVFAVGCKLKGG